MSVTLAQFESLKARRDTLFARVQSNAAKISELLAGSALQMQPAHDPNLRLSTPSVAGDPREEARAAAGILQGILPIPPFDPNIPDDQRQKILGSETLAGIVHMVPNAAQAVADIFTLSNPMNPGRAEAMDRLKNKPILQTASEVLMAVGALSGTAGVVGKFARPKVVAAPVIEPMARAVEAPARTIPEAVLPEVAKPIEVMADKTPDISQPPTPAPSVERLAVGDSPSAMTRAGSELGVESPAYTKPIEAVRADLVQELKRRTQAREPLPVGMNRGPEKYVAEMSERHARDWHSGIFDKEDLGPIKGGQAGMPPRRADQTIQMPEAGAAPKGGRVSSHQIVQDIGKEFDIPIRLGRGQGLGRSKLGFYKIQPEVVRMAGADDVLTALHEVGHHLNRNAGIVPDAVLKAAPQAARKELLALGHEVYGSKAPNAGYLREGLAEFFAHYAGTQKARDMAPTWTDFFEREVLPKHPDVKVKLDNIRTRFDQFVQQGAIERHMSRIDFGGDLARQQKPGVGERVDRGVQRFRYLMEDRMLPLKYAEKWMAKQRGEKSHIPEGRPDLSAYESSRAFANKAQAFAERMIEEETFDLKGNVTGPGLKKILEVYTPEQKREAFSYAMAKRMQHLKAERGKNVPPEWLRDADYVVNNLKAPDGLPTYEQTAQALTQFSDRVLGYAREAGVLTDDQVAKIRDANPVYISMARVFMEERAKPGATGAGGKLATASKPGALKGVQGESTRPFADPMESYIRNTAAMIESAHKAYVMRTLADAVEATQGAGRIMEKIPAPMRSVKFELKDIKKNLTDAGIDLSDADLDATATLWENMPGYFGNEKIVSFIRDGKKEYWQVGDQIPDLYNALTGMDNELAPFYTTTIGKIFQGARKGVQYGATALRPSFGLVMNPIRDAWTFLVQSENSLGAAGKAATELLTPEMRAAYRRSGTTTSTFLGPDRALIEREVRKHMGNRTLMDYARAAAEKYRDVISATEAGPRAVEFAATRKKFPEGSMAQRVGSMRAAQDVTTDFSRGGKWGMQINRSAPFFNAAIQGVSRFGGTLRKHPGKAAATALATITAPSLGLWWMNKDEDWYKAMPDWEKYGFWHFQYGPGPDDRIRIPKPFEFGYAFGSVPEAAMQSAYDRDPQSVIAAFKEWGKQMAPDPTPALIGPAAEVAVNYDTFRGRNIVPYFMEKNRFPEDQSFEWTPDALKSVGNVINVSPLKLQHLIQGYTGGMGADILGGVDIKEKADIPIVGRLFPREFRPDVEIKKLEGQIEQIDARYMNRIKNLTASDRMDAVQRLREKAAEDKAPLIEMRKLFLKMQSEAQAAK